MAEPPSSWNLLTASLSLSSLAEPYAAWAFLVVQGLVRDAPGDREWFARVAVEESALDITGPTAACRVAMRLEQAGLARAAGLSADPWGWRATERLSAIEDWTGGCRARDFLELLQKAGVDPPESEVR